MIAIWDSVPLCDKNIGLPITHYVHSKHKAVPSGYYCAQGVKMFSIETQGYEFRLDDYDYDSITVIERVEE